MKHKKYIMGFLWLIGYPMATEAKTSFYGLRTGMKVGYITSDSKINTTSMTQIHIKGVSNISGKGTIYSLCAEYGWLQGLNMYLGIELNIGKANSSGKFSSRAIYMGAITEITKIKLRNVYDLNGKLGYLVNDLVLLYIKGGGTSMDWKTNTVSDAPVHGSTSTLKSGFIIGYGAELAMENKFSVEIDYSYRKCSYFKYRNRNIENKSVRQIKVKPNASAITIGLKYKIN